MTFANSVTKPLQPVLTQVTNVAAPIGDYVKYKNEYYVVVDFNDNMTQFKLLNPTTNVKVQVAARNISATPFEPMVAVSHQGATYLRSMRGMMISLTTNRVMKWDANNGNTKSIMAAK